MKTINIIFCSLILMLSACKETPTKQSKEVVFNQALADELEKMANVDQVYAGIPQGEHEGNWEIWYTLRDSVERLHQKRLKEIIKTHGYPGYDLIGEAGESNFWVMTQHCDFDPDWQESVIPLLKAQVDKANADGVNYGYLVDRVRNNKGQPQVYGTQLKYNEDGQAYIEALEDREKVNQRRAAIGMETLESYLNSVTRSHFEMNKEHYLSKGITEPKLYKVTSENQ